MVMVSLALAVHLVHHVSDCAPLPVCLWRCGIVWHLQYCHCLRVSADTPLTARRRAHSAPGQYHEMSWCVCVCVYVCVNDDGTQRGET